MVVDSYRDIMGQGNDKIPQRVLEETGEVSLTGMRTVGKDARDTNATAQRNA